jgi:DNA-binding transcriptional LysR family regulator
MVLFMISFADINNRLLQLNSSRRKPAGTVWITTPEHAARTILRPAVDRITRRFPEVKVELFVESAFTDIVSERFDAGVRLGEQLAKDMIAIRIGPQLSEEITQEPLFD